ncbi:hypothetical protein [Marinobacterium lutimaris]|uniref:Preprotein translocase subunit YajC n=1 Tax=Marinobacterium lutimaris TaxID=568106 RepID=A0A1H5UM44_9GAMM|nr:hypothetical protein [Marinobacterium lutimaris]SEF76143.1 hypothetical protein SAMN05444390_101432 [Marinobacterium lutimaris]
MKWLIIILVVSSLVGSVMWVMPSPRERFQANLRLKARKLGFQVQIAQLKMPRQKGEMEAETLSVPVYRQVRTNLNSRQKDNWVSWHVCRGETLAQDGLPPGWSWITGEGRLSDDRLRPLCETLQALPDDAIALESTPIHLNVFWRERDEASLDRIKNAIDPLVEARI